MCNPTMPALGHSPNYQLILINQLKFITLNAILFFVTSKKFSLLQTVANTPSDQYNGRRIEEILQCAADTASGSLIIKQQTQS